MSEEDIAELKGNLPSKRIGASLVGTAALVESNQWELRRDPFR